ncbi:MAG: tetratricopeptide repeat protein [Gammaproteobacteria bacterium]|nr:tetratricopeptide repeat protein [Gammaproteobacteria bacterium]MBU1655451.1 tetratricopeptide repeat protein [Gammaproteobacteria bacterium]MBU1962418.1 tetratricopeptide repeat protein [Gammaproteobacteria bacterium]
MSLINDMLRDLEGRAENEKKAIDYDLPRAVATPKETPDLLRYLAWGGLLLLFLAALGYYLLLQLRINAVTPQPLAAAVEAVPAKLPDPVPQPVPVEPQRAQQPEPPPLPLAQSAPDGNREEATPPKTEEPPQTEIEPLPAGKEPPPAEEMPEPVKKEAYPPVRGDGEEAALASPANLPLEPAPAKAKANKAPSPEPAPNKPVRRVRQEDGLFIQAKRAWAGGRMAEAEEALARTLDLNRGHLQARLMLATLFLNEKRMAEAVRLTEDLPAGQGSHMGLIVIHAQALDGMGQTEAALAYLGRTLPEGRPSPVAVDQLRGAMLQKLGRYSKSAKVYHRLLKRNQADGQAWAGLGISLEGAGERDEALAAYRRALAINSLPAALIDYLRRRVNLLSNGAPL